MGRIAEIEDIAAGVLPYFSNIKMLVRGRPRFVDPQLESGLLRFATKRGFNCTAVIANNQIYLSEDAFKDSRRISLVQRPGEMNINTLIRIGQSAEIGEIHLVRDLIGVTDLETRDPLLLNYSADVSQNRVPVVSLIGTPCTIYAENYENSRYFFCESWHQIVPGDNILLSPTPEVFPSLVEYQVEESLYLGQKDGDPLLGEPNVVFKYRIALKTKTGLLPFRPKLNSVFYLKAQPLFIRDTGGVSDIEIPLDMGPCLLDAFFGGLLNSSKTETKIGLRTWDSFSQQLNKRPGAEQDWQVVPANYMILERPISSDAFLFWQRVTGSFQFQKKGFFLAELNDEGRFTMTSDLLAPAWPTDKERGWVIPVLARSPARCVVRFEPQAPQVFEIPSNSLCFLRPRIFTAPHRMLLHFSDNWVTGEKKQLNFSKEFSGADERVSFKINGTLIGPVRNAANHAATMLAIVTAINEQAVKTGVLAVLRLDGLGIDLNSKTPGPTIGDFVSEYGAPQLSLSQSYVLSFDGEFTSALQEVRFVLNNGTIVGPVSYAGSHPATVLAIAAAFQGLESETGVGAEVLQGNVIKIYGLKEFSLIEVKSLGGPPMTVTEEVQLYNVKTVKINLDNELFTLTSELKNRESLKSLASAIQRRETKRVNILEMIRKNNLVRIETAAPHLFQEGQSVLISIPNVLEESFKITNIPTATKFEFENIGKDASLLSRRSIINGTEVVDSIGSATALRAEVIDDRTIAITGRSDGMPVKITELSVLFSELKEDLRVSTVAIEPENIPIERIVVSFEGSPNSRIEMRDWQYDGTVVNSFSYYLLGSGDVFGASKWAAGGISLKPLFFNLKVLQGRYSDGVAQYNSGYLYI